MERRLRRARSVAAVAALVQSVERAAAILQVLAAQQEPMALTQLANSLGLAKGTAHGLVRTLVDVGFVDQDATSGLYGVGSGLLLLGSAGLDPHELRTQALNWCDALAARSGQAVLVAAIEGDEAVIAHHVFRPDASDQTSSTGRVVVLHSTAVGKILLAHDPRAMRTLSLRGMESRTYRTITQRAALLRELADVRDQGWAASVEEDEPGVAQVAAPIRDKGGYVIAAVGLHGPVEKICDGRSRPRSELIQHVVRAGRSISRQLGHGREL